MGFLALLGRIMFSALFIFNGVSHFLNYGPMATYAASKGIPYANYAVLGSGALLILGGLLVLSGKGARIGALLLFLFLVPSAIYMHNFWAEPDPTQAMNQMQHFLKNIALAGAALFMAAVPHWPHRHRRVTRTVTTEEPRLTITRHADEVQTPTPR